MNLLGKEEQEKTALAGAAVDKVSNALRLVKKEVLNKNKQLTGKVSF
jgi:hypothetical protein